MKKGDSELIPGIAYSAIIGFTAVIFLIYELMICNGGRVVSGESFQFSPLRMIVYIALFCGMAALRKPLLRYIESDCLHLHKIPILLLYGAFAFLFLFYFLYRKHLVGQPISVSTTGALLILFLLTAAALFLIGSRTELNFLIIGLTLLIVFPFATQMLHAVDEYSHFTEAYNVSLGHLFNLKVGSVIPKGFNTIEFNTPFQDFYANFQKSVNYSDTVLLDPNNIGYCPSGYPFVFYLPSAIGVGVGRLFHFNILSEMYIGRFFNYAAYLALGYLILRLIPFGKNIVAVILLSPYLTLLASTYSIDGIGAELVLLFAAYCFRLAEDETPIKIREYILLCFLAGCVLLFKGAAYSAVFLFVFMIPAKKLWKNQKLINLLKVAVPVLVAGCVAALGYLLYFVLPLGLGDHRGGNVDEVLQFRNMIHHLVYTAYVFAAFFINNVLNASWWNTIVEPYFFSKGSVVFLPMLILWLFVAITDHSADIGDTKFYYKQKCFMLLSFLISIFWVAFYFYLAFSPVGASVISGVNCRYLFPVLPLGLMALGSRHIKNTIRNYAQIVSYCCVFILLTAEAAMIIK